MKWTYALIILFVQVMLTNCFAASGSTEIPYGLILKQTVNFSIFFAALVYLVITKVNPYIKSYSEQYVADLDLGLKEFEEVTHQKEDYLKRMSQLESNFDSRIKKAEQDAESFYKEGLQAIEVESQRMVQMTDEALETEKQSVLKSIKDQVLELSFEKSKSVVENKMDKTVQERIQSEFIKGLQVVQ